MGGSSVTRDRLALFAYVGGVILATSVHDIAFLGIMLGMVVPLAGKGLPRIARRAFLSIVLFNSVVTVSYVLFSLWRGGFSAHYVVLVNLRVFLLTYMTFLLAYRIDPFRALSFSRSLLYLLTITYSQALTFRRIFRDFLLARKSRTVGRLSAGDLYRHGASTGAYFLQKAAGDAEEIARAMDSRGFFRA
jgi:cobalt/nickel transport system permease protein